MKQLLVILVVALLMFSCTSFEDEAKKQMKETMMELAKNPETFKITNIKTKYVCDSLCILHCFGSGQNGFGGWDKSEIEYIYYYKVKDDGSKEYREILFDLDERKSLYNDCVERYEKFKKTNKIEGNIENNLNVSGLQVENNENSSIDDDERMKGVFIYAVVSVSGIFNGRVIDKE